MLRTTTRIVAATVAVIAATAVGLLAAAPATAAAPSTDPAPSSRLAGADRYETAATIAAQFGSTAPVVWVASAESYPDALSAAPIAAAQKAPLLLTQHNAVPASVLNEIKHLDPGKIVLVGGAAAVSTAVAQQLQAVAPVRRIAGADRFDTSRRIAAYGYPDGAKTAYLASGLNFPDALSAASAAAHTGGPVLLVNGPAPHLDATTAAALKALSPGSLTVAGGPAAVSAGLEADARALAATEQRAAGADRFATSAAVNAAAFGAGSAPDRAYLASGAGFADALAGAALAGSQNVPLYVVQHSCLPAGTVADLDRVGSPDRVLLGGEAALTPAVAGGAVCGATGAGITSEKTLTRDGAAATFQSALCITNVQIVKEDAVFAATNGYVTPSNIGGLTNALVAMGNASASTLAILTAHDWPASVMHDIGVVEADSRWSMKEADAARAATTPQALANVINYYDDQFSDGGATVRIRAALGLGRNQLEGCAA